MTGTDFVLEVQPRLPESLQRLAELSNDLYYSWDRHTRSLFYYLDQELWDDCRHNPKVFLRRVSQERLDNAANDRTYLEEYNRVLAKYDTYHEEIKYTAQKHGLDSEDYLIAYFCAEFGLHESLPVYSGGLGILAGDYCKGASDLGLPFIAVGLLYRKGSFTQTIDEDGNQITRYPPLDLNDLPIAPARDSDGKPVIVTVPVGTAEVNVKVWYAKAGHTDLYLLDTDVDVNSEHDRAITFEMYPADRHKRLQQELILGIGGVRALRQLGLAPTVWHINEGHPSLLLLERWRELCDTGLDFDTVMEMVAANTVFTTHTPITAGHEIYDFDMLQPYVSGFIEAVGIGQDRFRRLGENTHKHGFNMTSFVLRCTRFHNGVSRVHRDVAARLENYIWPDISVEENPMGYVTNGIHVPTFLAREWLNLLDDPGWHNETLNPEYWQCIDDIADASFWSQHQSLKAELLKACCKRIQWRCKRCGQSQIQIDSQTGFIRDCDDVMVIGFARRFATYKRADLIFDDAERLARLLNDPERPVLLIFAGKAHPSDIPGQDLIRKIHALSQQPRFYGRILLLEGYDMALARELVTGVDVWLNNPEYPMEASGTSGMKAGINGVINLSILDGWWAEGYNGNNGWGIQPHPNEHDEDTRRRQEATELLDVLEGEVIPMYFDKNHGYSERWVKMAKESMKSIIPQFNSQRMAMDYINGFYKPAITMFNRLQQEGGSTARLLAEWKKSVNHRWSGVSIRLLSNPPSAVMYDEEMAIRVGIKLNGLDQDDIIVECLLGRNEQDGCFHASSCHQLKPVATEGDETHYEVSFVPPLSGLAIYRLRVYPYNPLLCHPLEMGYMKWLWV